MIRRPLNGTLPLSSAIIMKSACNFPLPCAWNRETRDLNYGIVRETLAVWRARVAIECFHVVEIHRAIFRLMVFPIVTANEGQRIGKRMLRGFYCAENHATVPTTGFKMREMEKTFVECFYYVCKWTRVNITYWNNNKTGSWVFSKRLIMSRNVHWTKVE